MFEKKMKKIKYKGYEIVISLYCHNDDTCNYIIYADLYKNSKYLYKRSTHKILSNDIKDFGIILEAFIKVVNDSKEYIDQQITIKENCNSVTSYFNSLLKEFGDNIFTTLKESIGKWSCDKEDKSDQDTKAITVEEEKVNESN
jgi:serine phosphatase RsbU (regulator of sigma subunit)